MTMKATAPTPRACHLPRRHTVIASSLLVGAGLQLLRCGLSKKLVAMGASDLKDLRKQLLAVAPSRPYACPFPPAPSPLPLPSCPFPPAPSLSSSSSSSSISLLFTPPCIAPQEDEESARRQEASKAEVKGKYDAMREHYREK